MRKITPYHFFFAVNALTFVLLTMFALYYVAIIAIGAAFSGNSIQDVLFIMLIFYGAPFVIYSILALLISYAHKRKTQTLIKESFLKQMWVPLTMFVFLIILFILSGMGMWTDIITNWMRIYLSDPLLYLPS